MVGLGSTISRLTKLRSAAAGSNASKSKDQLSDLTGFGTNPGALLCRFYIPENLSPNAPLVIVLHGCTQSASAYNFGSGWSQLADEQGFALLFPQQQRSNNPNLCFNWFSATDVQRDCGEVFSIFQMIKTIVDRYQIDPTKIFITGLSAGGAMACAMLATYPELFAGGAIIAGMPYGSATSVADAFARMRGQGYPSDGSLGAILQEASSHQRPWPTISVWQGSADATVDPINAKRIIAQWKTVHGVKGISAEEDVVDGSLRQIWRAQDERIVIESYVVPGMGHGTPLDTGGPKGVGSSGPYMIEAGISSTRHIAASWGLMERIRRTSAEGASTVNSTDERVQSTAGDAKLNGRRNMAQPGDVAAVITDAFRAAGLLR